MRDTVYTNTINRKDPSKRNKSPIKRSKYGVGKEIGGEIYLHAKYADRIPQSLLEPALDILRSNQETANFNYNVIVFPNKLDNSKEHYVKFVNCSGFDTEREPLRGEGYKVDIDNNTIKRMSGDKTIYHHKWLWVDDDYDGFNVDDSYNWSKQWLGTLDEPANGNSVDGWKTQLAKYNLKEHKTMKINENHIRAIVRKILSEELAQQHGSPLTSLDQVAATFTKFKDWKGRNLDIGGGKYDTATKYMQDTYGVENLVFDPFNRDPEWNKKVALAIEEGGADTVTVNNVLNVIKEIDVIDNIILQASQALKPNGIAYFLIYQGNESGEGKITRTVKDKGEESWSWQRNEIAPLYVPLIEKHFGNVRLKSPKSNVIIATDPLDSEALALWDFDGEYNGNSRRFKFNR